MKKDKFILNNNKCKCSYIARKPSYTSEFIACTSAAFFYCCAIAYNTNKYEKNEDK